MKPIYRKPGETERSYQLRRFNWEAERMSDCEVLQDMRRNQGEHGSGHFWQLEARSAYIRMLDARAKIARIDAETIPGTVVMWNEIFKIEEWPDHDTVIDLRTGLALHIAKYTPGIPYKFEMIPGTECLSMFPPGK